jgi:hypothetical protein
LFLAVAHEPNELIARLSTWPNAASAGVIGTSAVGVACLGPAASLVAKTGFLPRFSLARPGVALHDVRSRTNKHKINRPPMSIGNQFNVFDSLKYLILVAQSVA